MKKKQLSNVLTSLIIEQKVFKGLYVYKDSDAERLTQSRLMCSDVFPCIFTE